MQHGRNANSMDSDYWRQLDRDRRLRVSQAGEDTYAADEQPDSLAIRAVLTLYDAEQRGEPALPESDIADRLHADPDEVRQCVEEIRRERWVARDPERSYRLAARGRAVAEYERHRRSDL